MNKKNIKIISKIDIAGNQTPDTRLIVRKNKLINKAIIIKLEKQKIIVWLAIAEIKLSTSEEFSRSMIHIKTL